MRGTRGTLLLVVLAVLALSTAGFALKRTPAQAPYNGPRIQPLVETHRVLPAVAFLGDSYTGGSKEGGNGDLGWPAILAKKHHWNAEMFAVGGSGFVNGGQTNQPFGQRVDAVVAARPDVVLIEGGHNDAALYPAGQVTDAARAVVQRLHQALPQAALVVFAPIWPNGDPIPNATAIRDGLQTVAAENGAAFVDPLAEGWFASPYDGLIGSDRTHPTDEGHKRIAALVDADLTRLHVKIPAVRTDEVVLRQ